LDIGHSINKENGNRLFYSDQVVLEPTAFIERQDNYPSPLYSDQIVEFNSSGEQLFNK
jgi:hypothetical protein